MENSKIIDKTWFAIYVKSRNEKKVGSRLDEQKIEFYLPVLRVLKKWSDRKKWIDEPLFRSYIFVRIEQNEYLKVLQTEGVVRFITFEGKPVAVPKQQIEAIKIFLDEIEPENNADKEWKKGQLVEIISGNMTGLTGYLMEFKGKFKVSISIDAINRSIMVQIPKNKVRIIE